MAFEPSKHVNGRMWPPGVSGNPNGRPVGSRTVFSQSFLKDLASVWAERGRAAMEKTAIDQPGVFFATCARLIGPEVKLTIEQTLPGNLSMEDWQVMREIVAAVRQAIPDASSKPPGAVLEHVLTALRAADAKVLDSSENNWKTNSSICSGQIREWFERLILQLRGEITRNPILHFAMTDEEEFAARSQLKWAREGDA
jgi:hypothetical protein